MNEPEIQDYLYRYFFAGRSYGIPNIYLYNWESDFLSVTKAGRVHEYEIKISRSDFKADAAKTEKHRIMEHGCREPNSWENDWIHKSKQTGMGIPSFISSKLTADNKIAGKRPNYFWYVCPEGIITDVPEYAGLIYCIPYTIIKKAPLLHKDTITQEMEKKILSSFYYRYWKIRREQNAA